ncbi:MAG: AI-2E family transporter, partial [Neisseria sp.]|nr:AI-2E family transporter [Neisseria sp.]
RKMIPRRFVDTYVRISTEIDEVLSEFLRGQLMVMLIMGLFYGVGLMLVRLDSGFAIGMIAGLLVFIPYLGAFTGLLLATIAAMLQFPSWHDWVWVWAVFGIGQLLESFVVTPKIVGDRIGLSPFWVIFSLMAFGQLLGFVGMLAGLPLAAVSLVLLREGSQAYFNSRFYRSRNG